MDDLPQCIKGESNPRRVDGNDPGYHYPINAVANLPDSPLYLAASRYYRLPEMRDGASAGVPHVCLTSHPPLVHQLEQQGGFDLSI